MAVMDFVYCVFFFLILWVVFGKRKPPADPDLERVETFLGRKPKTNLHDTLIWIAIMVCAFVISVYLNARH